VSEAPEGFLDNFEDGGSGVLDPLDGVRTLKQTIHKYKREHACIHVTFQSAIEAPQTQVEISLSGKLSANKKKKKF
jgi:hypothetical protein